LYTHVIFLEAQHCHSLEPVIPFVIEDCIEWAERSLLEDGLLKVATSVTGEIRP
jgi:hypothetical protein